MKYLDSLAFGLIYLAANLAVLVIVMYAVTQ